MTTPRQRSLLFVWGVTFLFLFLSNSVISQDKKETKTSETPKVLFSYPLGVTVGTPTKITLRGLKLDTVTEIHCQEPKATVKLLGNVKKGGVPNMQDMNRVGNITIDAELTLPADFTGQTVTITVVSPGGESQPIKLLADRTAAIMEKEPNNGFREAQAVKLPQEINGIINNPQDVDTFRFEGKAGQKVIIEVFAERYGSRLDSMLTLFSATGQILASNDDIEGSTDSRIETKLPKDGPYFVTVLDAHDMGGPAHLYRLSLRVEGGKE